MVIVLRFKLYICLIIFALLITGFVMFQDKHREIGRASPVFDGVSNPYFVINNIFGVSSIYVWDKDTKKKQLLKLEFARISYLLLPKSDRHLYYRAVRGGVGSMKKITFSTKKIEIISRFSDMAFCVSDILPDNKLLVSYAPWIDTRTFFVGRTLGDWTLAYLDVDTGQMENLLQKSSSINSPKSIRGTDDILFNYFLSFEDPREFKIYNLKTKEERYLPIEVHVDQWCYDDKNNRIYFQGKGFVWEYDMASEKLRKLFAFKEAIDFLVKHPVEMKFLVKFSNNPKTMFYVDADGVMSKFFSI